MDTMILGNAMPLPTFEHPSWGPGRKARTLRDADWEPHKILIAELYTSGTTLNNVIAIVRVQTGFDAGIRQYKFRIKKWKIERNIKRRDMGLIVRKRQQRILVEPHRPELVFFARGVKVAPSKIDRWMHKHEISESAPYSPSSVAFTSTAIVCRTVSETESPSVHNPSSHLDIEAQHNRFSGKANSPAILEIWGNFLLNQYLTPMRPFLYHDIALCKKETLNYVYGTSEIRSRQEWWRDNVLFYVTDLGPDEINAALEEAFKFWLEIGVDLEHRSTEGMTPLLRAARYSCSDCLALLIKHGANIHAVDDQGFGALHMALLELPSHNYTPHDSLPHVFQKRGMVQEAKARLAVLFNAGCDPNAQDKQGRTPIQCVKRGGRAWRVWTDTLYRKMEGLLGVPEEEIIARYSAESRMYVVDVDTAMADEADQDDKLYPPSSRRETGRDGSILSWIDSADYDMFHAD